MDLEYWNNYYRKKITSREPSSFAIFCMKNYFSKGMCIVELGSGNCRDSDFFSKNGLKVYAIDQSHEAYVLEKDRLNQQTNNSIVLIESDFTTDSFDLDHKVDAFYSRFTMHSISESQQNDLISNVFMKLENEGLFCIEARTINDPMYGKGTKLGKNEYFTDHYRRFIDINDFILYSQDIGFSVIYSNESNGLSVIGDDDPSLLRIVMRKNS